MARELIDRYLRQLVAADGSDLHLRVGAPPRMRIHGDLEPVAAAPDVTEADVAAVTEAIVRPHLAERFGRGEEVDFAYTVEGAGRFRVNAYLQRDSAAFVFRRVLDVPPTLAELNLPGALQKLADLPRGLVLVAGPTGSGKTSTLAAMVDHINRTRKVHVVTIEDPVEVLHQDRRASISQREVGADSPDFATALRAALRQDPDVILVGEMRDRVTVATAISAAETGHLVLSTLHTTDATETITRMIEFFPSEEQRLARLVLAGTLKATVCQRLVPRAGGEGRVPATEVLVVNGRVQRWILDPQGREDVQEILADGDWYGMHTFDQSLLGLYRDGLIDLDAAMAAASNPHDLMVALRRNGLLPGQQAEAAGRVTEQVDGLADIVEKLATRLGEEAEIEEAEASVAEAVEPRRARRSRKRS